MKVKIEENLMQLVAKENNMMNLSDTIQSLNYHIQDLEQLHQLKEDQWQIEIKQNRRRTTKMSEHYEENSKYDERKNRSVDNGSEERKLEEIQRGRSDGIKVLRRERS